MSNKMNLLLIGYWGNGKSATANTVLGYDAFTKNNSTIAVNTVPAVKSSKDGKTTIVDGLCLWGKDPKSLSNDTLFDVQTAVEDCGKEGIDAIVIVVRYGEKFSEDEANLVEVAKKVFGPKVLWDFGVCLVTHGDDFKYAVEEGEEQYKTFENWCKKQTGNLGKLFRECGQRCVLFDNKTKDPKQIEDFLTVVHKLSNNGAKRYTMKNFHRVHGREFSPSDSKMLEMKTMINLQSIREKLKSNPGEKDLRKMGQELRKLSSEVAAEFKDQKQIEKIITEAQALINMIKSALEKMSVVSSQGPMGIMTGGFNKANGKQQSDMTFQTDHFKKDTSSCRPDDGSQKPTDGQHIADEAQKSVNTFEEDLKITDDCTRLLLLGRSGNGKSSTGNSILGQPAFKISSSTAATKSKVEHKSEKLGNLNLSVVDGPSLDDAVLDASSNLDAMIESIKEALQMCDYGFSGLLVVLKFGQRFTKQEKDAIVMIKSILGKDVLRKYGVCVMTHGDDFDSSMDDDERIDFEEWCRQQTGDIAELFQECSYKCVLFNNKTRDEQVRIIQRKKLLDCIKYNINYSKDEFLEAVSDFEELGIQFAMPHLEKYTSAFMSEVREKLHNIEQNFPKFGENYKTQLKTQLQAVQAHIDKIENLGHSSSSQYLLQLLTTLQLQINSKLRLCAQKEELEELEIDKQKLFEHNNNKLEQRQKHHQFSDFSSSSERESVKSDSSAHLVKLNQFAQTIYSRRCNANSLDRTSLVELNKLLVQDIDMCLEEAEVRGEVDQNLDKVYAYLVGFKDNLLSEINNGMTVQYPRHTGSNGQFTGQAGSTGQYSGHIELTGQYPGQTALFGQYHVHAGSTGQYPGHTGSNGQYTGKTGSIGQYSGTEGLIEQFPEPFGQYPVHAGSIGQYHGYAASPGQNPRQYDYGNTLTTVDIEDDFQKVLVYPDNKPDAYLSDLNKSASENQAYSQRKQRSYQSQTKINKYTTSHPQKEKTKVCKVKITLKKKWMKIKTFFQDIIDFHPDNYHKSNTFI